MRKKPETVKKESALSKGEVLQLDIEKLDADGAGIARVNGLAVTVAGALPGEKVRARVTHAGTRRGAAQVIEVLQRSPRRARRPACDRAGRRCDACPLIFLEYPAQLAWKKELVESQLRRYRTLDRIGVEEVIPSPRPLQYRNSAKLVIGGKFADPKIGIYRRGSHEVVDIGGCPLHHPLIDKVIEAVREGIRKNKVPIYSDRSGTGLLRYLVVRTSEAEQKAMAVFVTTERGYNEMHHLAKFVRERVPEVEVVAQNLNTSEGNVIFGKRDVFLTQKRTLKERMEELEFSISPRSFFQVNRGSAEIIYRTVREWGNLTGKEQVLDLYCGIGGISLFLAPLAASVTGIEVVEEAVVDAAATAAANRIRNCTFLAGDAGRLLRDLREEGEKFDLAVLNPPRKGCDESVLREIGRLAPGRIVYVSCSPDTLARDLDILSTLGYRTLRVQPVDMFPQTPHIENVALAVRE